LQAKGLIPILAVTQGDAAGVGPEILLKLAESRPIGYRPLLIAERAALDQIAPFVPGGEEVGLHYLDGIEDRETLVELEDDVIGVLDPVGEKRRVEFGRSGPADAAGALACLDAGIELARAGTVDALVTAPVSKLSIARQHLAGFRGHTDYVARACGMTEYGREYLMTFLAPELQVALLTTHQSLIEAAGSIDREKIVAAVECLHRNAGGRIAVAGLNPHSGEGGLLGNEEVETIGPAVEECRGRGFEVRGPESADSVFARSRRGEFDWVLALLHDHGLIAVKTSSFGATTNWTLGLPFIRTSVDHGTAFDVAGHGKADSRPLKRVFETTCELVSGRLPRRRGG
jgi:4-hydroxythreonine-4-phosphate dehydrogenase